MKKLPITTTSRERKNAAGQALHYQARDMEFSENITREEWDLISPPVKITAIIHGLYAIRNSAFLPATDATMKHLRCLALAVRMGDFQLIANAALSQITWPDQKADQKADMKAHAEIIAVDVLLNPARHGFVTSPPKGDILRYLEANYPQEFDTLQTSRRGLTDWWKRVSLTAKQVHG
jgi:hypothetical protein